MAVEIHIGPIRNIQVRPANGDWTDITPYVTGRPSHRSDGRVDYTALTETERAELHAWIDSHGIPHGRIPLNGIIELDEQTGEWRFETFKWRPDSTGRQTPYVGPDGRPVRCILRRTYRTPCPWPMGVRA